MRCLALDIGQARVGVAASDVGGTIAYPVDVLPLHEVLNPSATMKRIMQDVEPEVLVVGIPKTLAGSMGPQAHQVREIAGKIATALELPVEYVDERLSSQEAKRILRAQGLNEKQMRGRIDKVAASLFLQTYLDERQK